MNDISRSQVLLDLTGLEFALCVNAPLWETAFAVMARELHACVIAKHVHVFTPPAQPGLTAYFLLDASHLSVHTYADEGRAAIDVFACTNCSLEMASDQLLDLLHISPDHITMRNHLRRFTSHAE